MNELVERQLTRTEIRQRQVDHLRLLTEIDNYQSEIEEHARCSKDAKTEISRLQTRERELRRELRSGTVWEARQRKLGFADGSTDDPAEDIDPPEHDKPELTDADDGDRNWAAFATQWPQARDHEQLRTDLSVALQGVGVPTLEQLRQWHPDSGLFQGAAHWARLEVAHLNAGEFPQIKIPGRQPMPASLTALIPKPKKKR